MITGLNQSLERTASLKDAHKPQFFHTNIQEEKDKLVQILNTGNLFVHDELYDQLKELLKSRHPKRILGADDYKVLIEQHLNGVPLEEYGVWVYYPWSNRLLHILDEAEFIEVRTSRNQYKITLEERDLLATKKVGIIGLSVGQSVALTIAMERSVGEMRLADFDVLELTNLNRIRTGLHNLGVKKVISVAREIAEIDPYLKVVIFPDGLTEENMDDFFLGNGKLDVLIDECDGVDIKILCRLKAKSLQIPVLMEASDRGTIDVERFDLEPSRPILHGLIDHLDVTKLKTLKTNEERIPYLAPMVGVDTMSVRLKASAVEVGQSITTWPQLASAVVLGGGAVGDIWRRIALNQYHESGRYFVDMEEIVGNKKEQQQNGFPIPYPPLNDEDIREAAKRIKLDKPGTTQPPLSHIETILNAAITAPSGGNSQPWKWVYDNGVLSLFHDRFYSYSFMDHKERSSYIALGAALENIVLEAHKLGLELHIQYFPAPADKQFIAAISFFDKPAEGIEAHVCDDLEPFIYKRCTNRKITPRVPLPESDLQALKEVTETIPGARLSFFSDEQTLAELGKIVSATDKYRLLYPQSHADFTYQEMRWTAEEAENRRTGMFIDTLELRPSELIGARLVRDPKVVQFLRHIKGGDVFRGVSEKAFNAASVAGLLTMPGFSEIEHLEGGRASQRLWLKATQLDIAMHVVNVPLPFFSRLKYEIDDLPTEIVDDLKDGYERFKKLVNLPDNAEEIYLFRLFKAPPPDVIPLRRNLDDVFLK
jgi:molybdopterin/thiamine biosynthesis adenylyltransferase